jgi:hypothetical protein
VNHVTGKTKTGGILAALGGLAAAVGTFLAWATASAAQDEFLGQSFPAMSEAGIGDWTGMLTLLAGLVALGGGIMALTSADANMRRKASMAAGVAGILAILLVVIFAFRLSSALGAEASILETVGVTVGRGIGVYVSGIGGILAAIGGFMAMAGARETGMAAEPPAPPAV